MMMKWLFSIQCWFRDFLEQRGIDQQTVFRLESPGALQVVTLETVGAWLADLDGDAQEKIREKLIQIDRSGGSILPFLRYLARLVVSQPVVGEAR
jgi:hypothetical protein